MTPVVSQAISEHAGKVRDVRRGYSRQGNTRPADYLESFKSFLEGDLKDSGATRRYPAHARSHARRSEPAEARARFTDAQLNWLDRLAEQVKHGRVIDNGLLKKGDLKAQRGGFTRLNKPSTERSTLLEGNSPRKFGRKRADFPSPSRSAEMSVDASRITGSILMLDVITHITCELRLTSMTACSSGPSGSP